MNGCVQIRLQETFAYIPSKYVESDGYVYLDLKDDFDLRETKQVTELTDSNKLKFTFQLGFDLIDSHKNFSILKKFIHSNITDNTFEQIRVDVVTGSKVLNDNELYVRRTVNGSISGELRLGLEHWAIMSSSLKLNQIEHDNFTFNKQNIKGFVRNRYPYVDGDSGVWFPVGNYGNLIFDHSNNATNEYIIPIAQFRPYHYVTSLLQKGFCEIGWKFESPLFESNYGRKILTYIINRNYGLEPSRVEMLNARAEVDSSYTMGFQYGSFGRVRFPEIDNDISGNFNSDASFYSGNGEVNIKGKILIHIPNEKEMKVRIVVGKLTEKSGPNTGGGYSFGLYQVYDEYEIEVTGDNNDIEWEFEINNIPCFDIDRMGVFINKSENEFLNVLKYSFIEYEGVRKYWDLGDTENLGDLIDPEYMFLDFVKGVSHLLNLKWYTNPVTKTIKCFAPYFQNFFGEDIEGFYVETNINDITLLQDPTSMDVQTPELNQPRNINILFKQTTDQVVEEFELVNELWSRKIDLGQQYTIDEDQEIRNEFFEPTINSNEVIIIRRNIESTINLPTYRSESKHTWNINPRIMLGYGNVNQLNNGSQPTIKYIDFNDTKSEKIPTAGQFISSEIGTLHDQVSTPIAPVMNLVFGVNPEVKSVDPRTLYHIVYHRWILESYNNLKIQYLIDLTTDAFRRITFRDYYIIIHKGRTTKVRMDKVIDFHYCANIDTPIDFIPDKQVSDLCDFIGIIPDSQEFICLNNPVIICQEVGGGCHLFIIGGNNSSPILSVEFLKAEIDSEVYVPITNLTPTTAEVCGQTEPYKIKAIVTYDVIGTDPVCPEKTTPTKSIEVCPSWLGVELICFNVYNPPSPVLYTKSKLLYNNADYDESNITILEYRWSDFLGPVFNWMPYTLGMEIPPDEIGAGVFEVTFQYNSCPPVTLQTECGTPTGPPPQPPHFPTPCQSVELMLVCNLEQSGCYTFQLVGSVPAFLDYTSIITYRTRDDEFSDWSDWKSYKDVEVCGGEVQGKAMIIFCDNACEPMCIYSTCDPTCPFVPGTASMKSFCNDGNV